MNQRNLPPPEHESWTVGLAQGLLLGAGLLLIAVPFAVQVHLTRQADRAAQVHASSESIAMQAPAATTSTPARPAPTLPPARYASFSGEPASPDARKVADWIADSRNNAGEAFFIVDKKNARLYAFDADAHLLAATPVLLGGARGDDSVPGIGTRPIAQIRPEERTTPAGRFVGQRGRNASGEDIVWVDYDAAVSMHRVRATNPKERRLERLASPTAEDNRISWGCINVPVKFYETHVGPAFARQRAVVYVLPEMKSPQAVFGAYDVATAHAMSAGT